MGTAKFVQENTTTVTSVVKVSGSVSATLTTQNQHTHTEETEYYRSHSTDICCWRSAEAPSAVNQNDDKDGAFLTAVEVFISVVDESQSIKCQIRTTTGDDRPSRLVLAEKELVPQIANAEGAIVDNVLTSDASVPTKFVFDEPVYLAPGTAYAIVLIAEKSLKYDSLDKLFKVNRLSIQKPSVKHSPKTSVYLAMKQSRKHNIQHNMH